MPLHVQEEEGHTRSNLVHYHKTCFTTSYLLSRLTKVIDFPWLSTFVMKQGLGFFFLVDISMGESILQGGQKCCHIVLFSRGVCVWTSTMIISKHIFPKFLLNMVDYNTKNLIANNFFFSNLHCEVPKYICGKKKNITMY